MSYSPMPPNMRPQAPYQGYYNPHMAGPIPQYAPQYAQQWHPYQHMHHQPPPPPRAYPAYPQHMMQQAHAHGSVMLHPYGSHQPPHTPANAAPPLIRQQSSVSPSHNQFTPQTKVSSSLQSPFSPPPSSTPSTGNPQPETPPSTSSVVSQSANETVASSREPFFPPVSLLSCMQHDDVI